MRRVHRLVTAAAADIASIANRLLELGAPALCLVGGLAAPLRPWLPSALLQATVAPIADPLEGAIALARQAKPQS